MRSTTKIILINLAFFILAYLLLIIFSGAPVMDYIALKPAAIMQGMYLWTPLTSMFMHAGFFHLFVNMLSLFFLGSFLERIIGSKRFLVAYFGAGILGSLFFIGFAAATGDIETSAVGASGAIFGLGGMLAVLTPRLPVYIMFLPIPLPMWLGVTLALVVLWVLSIAVGLPIGNTAHLGGLVAGLAYAFWLRHRYKRKTAMIRRLFR